MEKWHYLKRDRSIFFSVSVVWMIIDSTIGKNRLEQYMVHTNTRDNVLGWDVHTVLLLLYFMHVQVTR